MVLSVIVAGAGWVSTHRHIPTIKAQPGVRIAGVVDRSPERARAAAEAIGVPWFAGDLPSAAPFFATSDAVVCGTAPFAHHRVATDALEHGKHVLTEKPFTMTVAEGEELLALAERSGKQLAIVHNFQFASSFAKVEKWIASGRLGDLRMVHAIQMSNPNRRLPTWYDDLPFGLFYDEAPHLLYLVRRLSGDTLQPVTVVAHPSSDPAASTPSVLEAHFSARPSRRVPGATVPMIVQMNFEAAVSEWHVVVSGTRGTAICDVFRDIAVFLPDDGLHETKAVLGTSLRGTLAHWGGYVRNGLPHLRGKLSYGNDEVFRRFVEAATTGRPAKDIGGADALAVLRLMHDVMDGARRSLDGRATG